MATLRRCEIGASLFTIVNCCLSNRSPSVKKGQRDGRCHFTLFLANSGTPAARGRSLGGKSRGLCLPHGKVALCERDREVEEGGLTRTTEAMY